MPPRIAIPMPHSLDRDYAERSIPQYERAVEDAGGQPVRIPLDRPSEELSKIIEGCDGVLLPGSNADVDPAKFNSARSPQTADADPRRDIVDELLLIDAYRRRKPVLGICYGLQSLNVFRSGSLIQHISDFLPEPIRTRVDHDAGRKVAVAHTVEIAPDSRLREIVAGRNGEERARARNDLGKTEVPAQEVSKLVVPVNSSHHQSADAIGEGLRISARCPDDGIIEALEGTDPDHFVLAVQWHPERSDDEPSHAIFRALTRAAEKHRE